MSYTYGFFDAIDQGGGNYDRVYTSAEFSHYWSLLVKNGVFGQPSTTLEVLAMDSPSMNVQVQPGTGWINGHYLTIPENDQEVVSIPVANPSLPRIDSVILALDNEERMMKIYLRSGSAASSPSPVELQRDSDIYELELAQITVSAGAGNINQLDIKDMRTDPERCGIVTGLIDQFDISGFLTASQASFNEWFENVKGQLGEDVAGNLLNLINGLQGSKLDISAKASREEALEGSDDTKYMTPLKTNQAIGTAPETVKDLRTGKLIRVVSSIDRFPLSPMTIKILQRSSTSSTNDLNFNGDYKGFYYAPGIDKLVMTMYKSRYSGSTWYYQSGYGYLSTQSLTQGISPTFVGLGSETSNDDYSDSYFGSYDIVSNDNLVKPIGYYSNNLLLIDLKTNSKSATFSPSYTAGCFATENKWGYIYISSYSNRTIYYSSRGSSSWSSTSLGSGNSSSYYEIKVIGVHGETLYFIERTQAAQWQLGKADFSLGGSPSITRGYATFDVTSWSVSSLSMTPLFHDQQYAYIRVEWSSGVSDKVLRIDLSDGTSNWSDFSKSSTMSLPGWTNTDEYIGTIDNKALFLSGGSNYYGNLYIVDKSTLGIAMLTMSTSVQTLYLRNRTEMVFSFPNLPGWASYRGKLINSSTGEVKDIIQTIQVASSNYVSYYLQASLVTTLCFAYAGLSVEDDSLLGLTGNKFEDPDDSGYKHYTIVDGSNPYLTLLASE